jgi:DNA-directed RNA polymerase subunit RPC12/RpoP
MTNIVNTMRWEGRRAKCLRCGEEWTVRKEGRPKQCPSCRNRLWDQVRESAVGAAVTVEKIEVARVVDKEFDFGS